MGSAAEQFREQAKWAARLGSPLYAHLFSQCASSCESDAALRDLLAPHAEPAGFSLPLRLAGAVHRLVLEGRAPELARYYPSAGGTAEPDAAWDAFAAFARANAAAIHPLLERPVQTNDAGRSGSLLGGFLLVAERTGLPLRLLELGSSAGLNLCWDRYRYEWAGGAWGDAKSPVKLTEVFRGGTAPAAGGVEIAARCGCDPEPLDVRDPATRLTLQSYTWADQTHRARLLDAAIGVARSVDYEVEKSAAADFLERRLAEPERGVATVVFHSVVWMYLSAAEQSRVTELIEAAGARATAGAPVAWLRMERGGEEAEVRLRIWPGFEERAIAATTFHTPAVRWHG